MTKSGTAQFSFDASGTNGLDSSGNIQKMTTTQLTSYDLSPAGSGTSGTDTYTYDVDSRELTDAQTGSAAASANMVYNDNGTSIPGIGWAVSAKNQCDVKKGVTWDSVLRARSAFANIDDQWGIDWPIHVGGNTKWDLRIDAGYEHVKVGNLPTITGLWCYIGKPFVEVPVHESETHYYKH